MLLQYVPHLLDIYTVADMKHESSKQRGGIRENTWDTRLDNFSHGLVDVEGSLNIISAL